MMERISKKILFVAPNYFGFNQVILDAFTQYTDCEIVYLETNYDYSYKNLFERLENVISKTFSRKNLKQTHRENYFREKIKNQKFDYLVINRPDMLTDSFIDELIEHSLSTNVILWDSLLKIPQDITILKKFDICFSFDESDCHNFCFKKLDNFYFSNKKSVATEFDVFFLGTYDNRFPDLIQILRYLKTLSLNVGARLLGAHKNEIPIDLIDEISVTNEIVPFSESTKYSLKSKIVLDLAHANQRGLSFRAFEALGFNKKLITTNKEILGYDFYNSNNICVLDTKNLIVSKDFISTPYQHISDDIKLKYHISNWIQNLLNH